MLYLSVTIWTLYSDTLNLWRRMIWGGQMTKNRFVHGGSRGVVRCTDSDFATRLTQSEVWARVAGNRRVRVVCRRKYLKESVWWSPLNFCHVSCFVEGTEKMRVLHWGHRRKSHGSNPTTPSSTFHTSPLSILPVYSPPVVRPFWSHDCRWL